MLRALFVVIGGLFAAIALLTQVPPETAMSNLQAWAVYLGVQNVPAWVAAPRADAITASIALVAALASFGVACWLRKKTTGVPKSAPYKPTSDPRQEMTLKDVVRHVGLGGVQHLSPTPEINVVHDFVCDLRQRLRSGEIGSWGQPHDKYPPATLNLKPLKPIEPIYWRDCGIFAYEAFQNDPEMVKSMPDRAQGPAMPTSLATLHFDLTLKT